MALSKNAKWTGILWEDQKLNYYSIIINTGNCSSRIF